MPDSNKLKYLQLLGQITIDFNKLEDALQGTILFLTGNADLEVVERITAGDQFQSLLRLFNVLFRYRVTNPIQLKRLNDLNEHLDGEMGVNRKRNEFLHSSWLLTDMFGEPTTAVTHKRAKTNLKKYKADYHVVETAELENFIRKLNEATLELRLLIADNQQLIKDHIDAYNQLWTTSSNEAVRKFYEKYKEEKEPQE